MRIHILMLSCLLVPLAACSAPAAEGDTEVVAGSNDEQLPDGMVNTPSGPMSVSDRIAQIQASSSDTLENEKGSMPQVEALKVEAQRLLQECNQEVADKRAAAEEDAQRRTAANRARGSSIVVKPHDVLDTCDLLYRQKLNEAEALARRLSQGSSDRGNIGTGTYDPAAHAASEAGLLEPVDPKEFFGGR